MDTVTPVAPPVAPVPGTPAVKAPEAALKAPDASGAASVKAETKAEKAVLQKIKVGDTEYDSVILEQMIEKAKGADKKFLEASKAHKEAVKFFKLAKENPKEFLARTGTDPQKWSYEQVAQDIKDKLRDPKEVALEKAEAELKTFREKEAAEKAKLQADKETREAQAWKAKFEQEIIGALESHPALPKNGFTVARVAQYISTVRDKTGVLLNANEVAGVIEKDIRSEVAGIVKGATAEQLLELIGEEGANAIRKYDLAKLKNPLSNGTTGTTPSGEKQDKKGWKNSKEFWKTIKEDAKRERGEI